MMHVCASRSWKFYVVLMAVIGVTLAVIQPARLAVAVRPASQTAGWIVQPVGQLGGSVMAVALHGNVAYVAQGSHLLALDISNEANPVEVWKSELLPGTVGDLVISGNFLYASAGARGLFIYNISSPLAPVQAGYYASGGHLSASGQRLYIAAFDSGLKILDISNAARPVLLGSYPLQSMIAVAAAGDRAYVLAYDSGFKMIVLDVSAPANPVRLGHHAFTKVVYDIALSGSFALVAGSSQLTVLDVADPANVQQTDSFSSSSFIRDVAVAGNYVYFADWDHVSITRLESSGFLTFMGSIAIQDEPTTIDADGSRVLIGGSLSIQGQNWVSLGTGMAIINVTQPTNPQLAGTYQGLVPGTLRVSGGRAYTLANGELSVIDVTDPANPSVIGSYSPVIGAGDLEVEGSYAYLISNIDPVTHTLQILNISNPADIQLVGVYESEQNDSLTDVEVSGSYAYLTDAGVYGLHVVDITDPSQPTAVYTGISESLSALEIEGNHAFLANFRLLMVYDISTPSSPAFVGQIDIYSQTGGFLVNMLEVEGGYVYFVLPSTAQLNIVDATNPSSMTRAAQFQLNPVPRCLSVVGNDVYVCNTHQNSGLRSFDVSVPASPQEQLNYLTPGVLAGVVVDGNRLYVNDTENGLLILDIVTRDAHTIFLPAISR